MTAIDGMHVHRESPGDRTDVVGGVRTDTEPLVRWLILMLAAPAFLIAREDLGAEP